MGLAECFLLFDCFVVALLFLLLADIVAVAPDVFNDRVEDEEYGCTVNDKARVLGGRQSIRTPEGDVFKLRLQSGLLYLPLRFPTDHELKHIRIPLLPITSKGYMT